MTSPSDKGGSLDNQPCQTSNEDLLAMCLDHYERVSSIAHEWNNQVPQAIKAWYAAKSAAPASGNIDWLNDLKFAIDSIYEATGSALLAGEECKPGDPGTIREMLLAAVRRIDGVRDDLLAAPISYWPKD